MGGTCKASNNPYTVARRKAKMSAAEYAQMGAFSFSAVWNLDRGLIADPNPRFKQVLADVGVDVTGIDEAYQMWRKAEAQAMIRRFAAAKAARYVAAKEAR